MQNEEKQDVDAFFEECPLVKDKNSFIKLKQLESVKELINIGLSKEDVFYYVDHFQCYPSTILHKLEYCGKNLTRFREKYEIKRQMTVEDAMQFSNDVEFMNSTYTKIPFILIAHTWFLGKGLL